MAEADHTPQIAKQRPCQRHAAYDQSGDDQTHYIVVVTQDEWHPDIGGQYRRQRDLAMFHPRLLAAPNKPFGSTKSTNRNSTIPTSSCRAELANVIVSASVSPSSTAPTSTPGIDPMPASTVMMNALIVRTWPREGWITP